MVRSPCPAPNVRSALYSALILGAVRAPQSPILQKRCPNVRPETPCVVIPEKLA